MRRTRDLPLVVLIGMLDFPEVRLRVLDELGFADFTMSTGRV